jgi:hypothetical protein
MKVVLRTLYKLAGIVMLLLGLFIIIISWTAHFGIWPDTGFLSFLQDTWVWSIIMTLTGGYIIALGIVFVRV